MLCINNTSTDIYFNLAAEEYLLKERTEDLFMLWQSNNAVVLGKHQHISAEINSDFVKNKQISIARRYSGGGTVYQDMGNVNLTFISNSNRMDFSQYTQYTLDFLNHIGIRAEADERLGINIERLKISGSAQCVYKDRSLYHCTLLYSSNLETLISSLESDPNTTEDHPESQNIRHVRSVKSDVTNISRYLPDPPDIQKFKESILTFFSGNDNGNNIYKLNEADILAIKKLKTSKYAAKEWITGKTY